MMTPPSNPFGQVEAIIIRITLLLVLLIDAIRFILHVLG